MIYPMFPDKNDLIGICAPSAGVGHKLESFDKSLDTLRAKGFSIVETDSVRVDNIRSASAEIRGAEFNQLTCNNRVKMIIAASGGEYNFEMLPYIDIDKFIADPKWIVGASDPTNIMYWLTTKYDIATIYGVNAGTFDWEPLHQFQVNALEILSGNVVSEKSFAKYDDSRDFSKSGQVLNGDVMWNVYMPGGVQADSLDVSGRIVGGCSDVISNLIGTPYDGTKDFLRRYSDEGIIWFLDPYFADPISFHIMLLRFKSAGYFQGAKAVIVGRIMFPGEFAEEDFINEIKYDLDCPVIWGADIGHVKPCMTVINGSYAHLSCSNGKAELSMELK